MRRLPLAVSSTLIALASVACGPSGSNVADLSVVTRLPKEVGPGGFQSTVAEAGFATGYFFKSEVSDCGAAVRDSARAWAGRHGFSEGEGAIQPRVATLRLNADPPGSGVLVIRYTVSSDHSLGRVRITHEAGAGGATPTPPELVALGVQELVEAELAAAQCSF